jgi:lipopolysaccharide transport system ATP-binding protein
MSDIVIRAENLGKKYLIPHQHKESYTALRDVLANSTKSLAKKIVSFGRRRTPHENVSKEDFWALKDVFFDVKQGERVGIIGRNGAGKTTLLKLLSRITEPSAGRISIKGKVASLLEVGTGFHPELTGRENIFLNGAILGMNKAEIKKHFDEIVDFAEVEKFLDTPVKRYSSGMYVRLAFAVAAHLEPEILMVDEVLAVGDAQFQKKCLGKMEEVGKEGRTVLFVSHNTAAIKALCTRAILLVSGELRHQGKVIETLNLYAQEYIPPKTFFNWGFKGDISAPVKILKAWVDQNELEKGIFSFNMKIYLRQKGILGAFFSIKDEDGTVILWTGSQAIQLKEWSLPPGEHIISCIYENMPLNSGKYLIEFGIALKGFGIVDHIIDGFSLTIDIVDPYGSGFNITKTYGFFHMPHTWRVNTASN